MGPFLVPPGQEDPTWNRAKISQGNACCAGVRSFSEQNLDVSSGVGGDGGSWERVPDGVHLVGGHVTHAAAIVVLRHLYGVGLVCGNISVFQWKLWAGGS